MLPATTNLHLRTTGTRKLMPRWIGAFKVLARMALLTVGSSRLHASGSHCVPCLSHQAIQK